MVKGSLIHRLNGKEYYFHKQGLHAAPDGRREVAWISPDGIEHTFNFAPGRIGISSGRGDRPDLYVFRNSPRGEWDRDLLIAATAWYQGDHVLAESGLLRAKAKGLPDSPITAYYQALFTFDRGDLAGARKAYDALLAQLPADKKMISRFYHPGLVTLGLAFQDFDTVEAAVVEREGMKDELQPATVRNWKAWAAGKPHESLLARAVAGAGEELRSKIIKLDNDWSGPFEVWDPKPFRKDGYAIVLKPSFYDYRPFTLPTPLRDAIWEVTVALRDSDELHGTMGTAYGTFEIALVDRPGTSTAAAQAPDSRDARRLIGLKRQHVLSGERIFCYAGSPDGRQEAEGQLHIPMLLGNQFRDVTKVKLPPGDPRWVKFTLIRLGNEAEILLNGQTVFHIPVDPKAGDLGFFLQGFSTSFIVKHMSLRPIASKN